MKTGILYGLGVGPGDPELVTVKAWRIISMAPVVAYLTANGTESTARDIAKPFLPDDVIELKIDMPMRTEREPAQEAYDRGAAAITEHLKAGRDVAMLCEGDPFFYGSFMYIFARLADRFETVVVPGVSSITAAAARIGRPLSARNDVLKVLPATLEADRLREELLTAQSIAIIKVGRHFGKIKNILSALDLISKATVIENATRANERIRKVEDVEGDSLPYFTTILIYTGSEFMVKPVIFILGISALPLAQKLKADLNGEIHTPDCVAGGDVSYAKATAHLAQLFQQGQTIIGLCASGILIRAIAPHLNDKRTEPPVLAVAEDASSIIPLLGGHHGANTLAAQIAKITGGHAAITTASDVRFGSAFDELREGYTLANPEDMKSATAAKLAGGDVRVETTEHITNGGPNHIVYHPHTLTIGVGCERGASPQEVSDLIESTLKTNNLSIHSVAGFASIDLKEDEPAIEALCNVRFFSAEELNEFTPKLKTPSDYVMAEVGTPGVAEAAALAAAGTDAELIVAKTKSKRATCAIARSPAPILEFRGKARGVLSVVGIGPGSAISRSPAATEVLRTSTDWVGYGLYLDLVADLKQDQIEHRFSLGGEEDRVRHAIDLAKQGKQVALVCSGDAGIYAMAALVYEIIDLEPNRIKVEVIPGISAFQAAAAKAGAMIGHDFCCISLSDLLTPWEAIEKRVKAAAEGDFVISFYNPRSLKRRDQLERAFAILKNHRSPDTPVIIASNLGRAEENVRIVTFADFNPDDVDMLTLVMVGSSQSKSFARGDGKTYAYTPRGYAKKRET